MRLCAPRLCPTRFALGDESQKLRNPRRLGSIAKVNEPGLGVGLDEGIVPTVDPVAARHLAGEGKRVDIVEAGVMELVRPLLGARGWPEG